MSPAKKLSWEPVLDGEVYCSPACGGRQDTCTKEKHDAAVRLAGATATVLGPGWVPSVWENLGWHAMATSPCGRLKVHAKKGRHYLAFLNKRGDIGGRWSSSASTAKAAVAVVVREARAELAEVAAIVEGL